MYFNQIGAFGSGAAFALEDGWILARAIEQARRVGKPLSAALTTFDSIRSPYYLRMYEYLDQQKQNILGAKLSNPNQTFEEGLKVKVGAISGDSLKWIYFNNIEAVWEEYRKDLDRLKG